MFNCLQASEELDGIHTELVIQAFADRIFVLITQMGKVGNLIQASIPSTTPLVPVDASNSEPDANLLPPPPPAIQLTPLLGSAPSEHIQTLHSLYTAQVATLIWIAESEKYLENNRRSVIVGIALKKSEGDASGDLSEHERNVFHGSMVLLQKTLAAI
ncbi:hypothetical protein BJ138DRAFT_1145399 [Hygrophoropsis aurantiaca]|uniref:Uncharacterized protein n=1 Tax=Hygrophoropsis aurantiaca TaxID=72124 RepID=A0ACB8AJM1_9AGAM|nr:hypothetical protein BJ138DRAFT_1145399 [Hygrophoropsis aurantiaca]